MADSDLICSGLVANSGVGQIVLSWTVTDPSPGRPPYLTFLKSQVFASTSNNRALAVKIWEGNANTYTHAGVTPGVAVFYWVRAVNAAGASGEFFPLSATAGVTATADSAQPEPGSITAVELAPGSVTTPAIAPSAVTTTEIADAAIARAKIAFAAVGSSQIENASITSAKIADAAITRAKIENAAIGTAQIENASITSAKIVSLDAGKINATSLSAISANLGTVTAGTINGVTINGGTINGITINAGSFRSTGSGPRVEIPSIGGRLFVYDETNALSAAIGRTSGTAQPAYYGYVSTTTSYCATFQNVVAAAVLASGGTYAFYAGAGSYGPFTGAHDALWPRDKPLPEVGDLVADDEILFRDGVSNTLASAKFPEPGKPALGVFVAEMRMTRTAAMAAGIPARDIVALRRKYRLVLINALGEGQINVCDENGPVESGDLLVASGTPGKAMKQNDDLLRASTVARSRETVVFDPSGRALAACIYLGG